MRRPLVDNFTTDQEAQALADLAKGKTVLEVGTYKGFGAILMAQHGATHVVAVDWHKGDADLGEIDTLTAFWTNVRRHKVEDKVFALVGRSEAVLPLLAPHSFDMAFIDGYHAYDAVQADIRNSLPLMKPGAVMAFHDFGVNDSAWGVKKAVTELHATNGEGDIKTYGSLAVIKLHGGKREPFTNSS